MALTPGSRLGPYELVALVGTGGMGHVYRARDTRLDRTVAIKVLTAEPSEHAQSRERFDREARAVSSLNHPNICTLHDIGHADGIDFFVMEFLDGETLAARLARSAVPLDHALRIAVETADALARAHAAGIVHRDLKPANIMLTKSGVKLLDFGIAKVPAVAETDGLTRTRPQPLTQDGSILGTVQYMAPEQLEGKPLDARTDIFAFGAVLYEMIAGRPAFDAQSQAGLIAAILSAPPTQLASVQPNTPPAVDRVVMTCLAKDPDDRWQSSLDLLRELRWLSERGGATAAIDVQHRPRATPSTWVLRTLAGVAIGAVAGAAAVYWLRPAPASRAALPVARFALTLPPGDALATSDNQSAGAAFDLSPDGSKLVYAVGHAGNSQLMLRTLDRLEPAPLPGTEGARAPFFSPDGEWIGFFSTGKLNRISVSGGIPLLVTAVPPVTRGGTWAADGTIYLTPTFSDPIYKVRASGGTIAPVTTLAEGESNHLLPQVLPGGAAVIFTAWKGGSFDEASVWVWSAATGRRKLIDSASGARYASTGHLIFSRGSALLAAPFDLARLEVTGEALPVADGVLFNPTNGTAEFALSASGSLVYATMPATATSSSLVWVDRSGHDERIADIRGFLERPRLSADGRRVAVENLNDLWVYDFATAGFRRATFQGVNQYPVWSPDGRQLMFSRAPSGKTPTLLWGPADGDGQAELMTANDQRVQFPNDWSPDGRTLAFVETPGVGKGSSWDILGRAPDGKISPIVNSPYNEYAPAFAADGRWIAYVSDQSGRREIYVRPFPGPGPALQITSAGGDQPRWGRDGKELFYYQAGQFMRAQVNTKPELSSSKPERLFEGPYRHRFDDPGYPSYDVSPDGRRFLMIKASNPDAAPSQLTVVLNWFEELTRRTRRSSKS